MISKATQIAALFSVCLAIVPATAASSATVIFTGTRSNINIPTPVGVGRCGPTLRTVTIAPGALTSTGTSNFGNFAATQSMCVGATFPAQITDGIFTYDFEAGDQFSGTLTGSVVFSSIPGVLNSVENLTVTGGTGRFLGATGNLTSTGNLTFSAVGATFNGSIVGLLNTPAVPEPTTWAMMLLGFGFVGGAMRSARRRQKLTVSYA